MTLLSTLYGRAAIFRRSWYAASPRRTKSLTRPVISVGNLVVGGSGKTPVVAALARMLADAGERPSVLSRGYGRRKSPPGVVVVSDGTAILADASQSGDEPFMLARKLQGVAVLVSPSRHEAGIEAEKLGCTVHLLDDGFQHVQLKRDVNLLLVAAADLDERVLPSGRLREPLTAAKAADALLVEGSAADAALVANRLAAAAAFTVTRRLHPVRPAVRTQRVVAVAGIAQPERFFSALRAQGFEIACEFAFRDHHWFTPQELATVEQAARDADATIITTEKDAARLENRPGWAVLPVEVVLDESFAPWLAGRLAAARRQH